ncbi:MAG: hypothetical protein IT382_02800 [Deltaproteobacteria bacterium]|nr:hypothetical protein [Deltaproteobacteria bacterium]
MRILLGLALLLTACPTPEAGSEGEGDGVSDPEHWVDAIELVWPRALMSVEDDVLLVHIAATPVGRECTVERRRLDSTLVWQRSVPACDWSAALAGGDVLMAARGQGVVSVDGGDRDRNGVDVVWRFDSATGAVTLAATIAPAPGDVRLAGRSDGSFSTWRGGDCHVDHRRPDGTILYTSIIGGDPDCPYNVLEGDDTFFLTTRSGGSRVLKLDLSTGDEVWSTALTGSANHFDIGAATIALCSSNAVHMLSSSDGAVLESMSVSDPLLGPISCRNHDGGVLISDGAAVLEVRGGDVRWLHRPIVALGAEGAGLVVVDDALLVAASLPSQADVSPPLTPARVPGRAGARAGVLWRIPLGELGPIDAPAPPELATELRVIEDGWIALGTGDAYDVASADAATGEILVVRDGATLSVSRLRANGELLWSAPLPAEGELYACKALALPARSVIACSAGGEVQLGGETITLDAAGHVRVIFDANGVPEIVELGAGTALALVDTPSARVLVTGVEEGLALAELNDSGELGSAVPVLEAFRHGYPGQFDATAIGDDLLLTGASAREGPATFTFDDETPGSVTVSGQNAGIFMRASPTGRVRWGLAYVDGRSYYFFASFLENAASADGTRAISCGTFDGGALVDFRTGAILVELGEGARATCVEVDANDGTITELFVVDEVGTLTNGVSRDGTGWLASVVTASWRTDTGLRFWPLGQPPGRDLFDGGYLLDVIVVDNTVIASGSLPARSMTPFGAELPGLAGDQLGVTFALPRAMLELE